MDAEAIVRAFFAAIEQRDWGKVEELTTEEFLFWGPLPRAIDKQLYIELQKTVQRAIPDWSYHLSQLEVRDNCVTVSVRITGTHTEPFALPVPGVEAIPPTGIKFELPVEGAILTLENGKIFDLRVEDVQHQGLKVLFEKLGR